MKKFVLSLALLASLYTVHAQVYLSEMYVRPQSNENEYFELYNAGTTPADLNCYSLVTYFKDGSNRGVYVVDFPAGTTIPAKGFFVAGSAQLIINYQGGTTAVNMSWNDGNIYRYTYTTPAPPSTGGLQLDQANPPTYNDLFLKSDGSTGNNGVYAVFLFNGNTLVDALLGSHGSNNLPSYIKDLGTLSFNNGCGAVTINFATLNQDFASAFAHVNPSAGTDNGYYRQGNGPCNGNNDNWTKSSSPSEHTPGLPNPGKSTNGGNANQTLSVTSMCTADGISLTYSITGGASSMYPLTVSLYNDVNGDAQLNTGDALVSSRTYNSGEGNVTVAKPANTAYLLLYIESPQNCTAQIVPIQCGGGVILPVNLRSFNVRRSGNSVNLTWETATEVNNLGFYVQRLIGNGTWETLGFIPTQASGGNSNSVLSYTFSDVNTTRGVTQYRLRQVDADGKARYSEIRTVRSSDLTSRVVLYPNPSNTGSVTVVFDDATALRDVYVSDFSGRVVKQWRSVSNNNIQVDNLNPGVYTVRIVDVQSGAQSTEKFVVNQR